MFPPIYIQHSQCPCRCLLERRALSLSLRSHRTNYETEEIRFEKRKSFINKHVSCKFDKFGFDTHLCELRVVVVVLTLARIIKSVVTGQATVTLELSAYTGRSSRML